MRRLIWGKGVLVYPKNLSLTYFKVAQMEKNCAIWSL